MKFNMRSILYAVVVIAVVGVFAFPSNASATNSWGGYHWARTANPFTLKLGDNVSGLWDGMLITASSDWTASTVLNTTIVPGGTRPKGCRPTSGQDEVCSADYGNTGWLGLAQIWITGGEHITQGVVKNNDYYFGSSSYQYNNTQEMQHVICQEIGHTFGLDHQSTDGSSQNTCMDYYHNTSNSDTTSTHPNTHDYNELVTIYTHLDSFSTLSGMPAFSMKGGASNVDVSERSEWGTLVSNSAREATFVRDFGGGEKVVTFVIWVQ